MRRVVMVPAWPIGKCTSWGTTAPRRRRRHRRRRKAPATKSPTTAIDPFYSWQHRQKKNYNSNQSSTVRLEEFYEFKTDWMVSKIKKNPSGFTAMRMCFICIPPNNPKETHVTSINHWSRISLYRCTCLTKKPKASSRISSDLDEPSEWKLKVSKMGRHFLRISRVP